MPEESAQSIVIDAPRAAIMAVIADFANYPAWTGSVTRAEVLEAGPDGRAKRVGFRLEATVMVEEYELDYVWSGDERVDWSLVSGQLIRAQQGSYVLTGQGDATLVTYTLAVDLAFPMLGLLKRKAERMVMDTALKELKKRVESVAV
jgi:hypothetical protein